MENLSIDVGRDFHRSPMGRFPKEGLFNGQKFQDDFLLKKLEEAIKKGITLTVDLRNTIGYASSFYDTAFAGLVRDKKITYDEMKNHLEFIPRDNFEGHVDSIWKDIERAAKVTTTD